MYISPNQFNIVNENTKQVLNDENKTQRQLICTGESFVHAVTAIQDKRQRQCIVIQQSLCSGISCTQNIQLPRQCFSWCRAKLIHSFEEEHVLQSVYQSQVL
jgi:hypothetical protein